MWSRKNRFEQGVASAEANTAAAVEQLADTVRDRLDHPSGEQVAGALSALAKRVEDLELADQLQQSRRQLRKAAKQAGKRVERSGQQLAEFSSHTVPSEPTGWIAPTFLGFLLGFGLGFLIANTSRRRREPQHG